MIKVRVSPDLLEYQKMMLDVLSEIQREKIRVDLGFENNRKFSSHLRNIPFLELYEADLLKPPAIELIDLSNYDGENDALIQIRISYDYEVLDVLVNIRDDQGNIIESEDAIEDPYHADLWCYITSNLVPSHTSITVSVTAIDYLGGVATQNVSLTIL